MNTSTILFFILAVIIVLATILIIIRFRSLTKLFMLSTATQALPNAAAFTLSSNLQNKPLQITYLEFPYREYYLTVFLIFFLIFLLLVLFLRQLYKKRAYLCKPMRYFYNPSTSLSTDILLEVTSATHSVVLYVLTVAAHYTQIHLENPTVTIHSIITGCCTHYLRLGWHHTTFSIPQRFNNINLPDMLSLPLTVRKLTHDIITDPNLHINILVGTNGIYMPYNVILHTYNY
jgi:hypothetical protein